MTTKKKLIPLPNLRRVREDTGLSMRTLHEISGASISTIHGLETSGRGAHRSTARKLAEALNVGVSVLAGREVDMGETRVPRLVASGPPRDTAREGKIRTRSGGSVPYRSGLDEVLVHLESAHRAARKVAEAEGRSEEEVLAEVERHRRSLERAALLRGRMRPLSEALESARAGELTKPEGTPEEDAPELERGETLAESVIEDRE